MDQISTESVSPDFSGFSQGGLSVSNTGSAIGGKVIESVPGDGGEPLVVPLQEEADPWYLLVFFYQMP